jgi:hypothetical protein
MDFFTKPVKKRVVDPLEPIPVGVVEEADWADWEDSVGFQDSQPVEFQNTDKLPLVPAEGEFVDVFACVAPKGQ